MACKTKNNLNVIVFVIVLLLLGCGNDITKESVTQSSEEKMVVSDISELSDCLPENEGRLAHVKGESSPRICVDGEWLAPYEAPSKTSDFSCKVEKLPDGSGLKIICNGDSIGVVLNGVKGDSGDLGIQGLKGDKGDQGEQGIQGEKGDKGDQGEQGIQGEKGDKGDQGEQGIQGEKGDQGEQGIQGEKGDKGDQGEQGIQGEKGDQGEQGIQGEKGGKGDQGERGIQGEKGDKGESGIQGEKGDKGEAGSNCSIERDGDFIMINCGENNAALDLKEVMDSYSLGFCSVDNEGATIKRPLSASQDSVYRCQDGIWMFSIELSYGTLVDDRDQRSYKTIVIGEQTWMAENLNYYDSNVYPEMVDNSWCNNDVDTCAKYGRRYYWHIAMDSVGIFSTNGKGCGRGRCFPKKPVRGICPTGWHLPDTTEWRMLFNSMDSNPYAMQMLGFKKWELATNSYGFSAIPQSNGTAMFWSSVPEKYSELFGEYGSAFIWNLTTDSAGVESVGMHSSESVRCVKD